MLPGTFRTVGTAVCDDGDEGDGIRLNPADGFRKVYWRRQTVVWNGRDTRGVFIGGDIRSLYIPLVLERSKGEIISESSVIDQSFVNSREFSVVSFVCSIRSVQRPSAGQQFDLATCLTSVVFPSVLIVFLSKFDIIIEHIAEHGFPYKRARI
jgi:hypothetical protein